MSRVRAWTDEEVGWLLDHPHLSARIAGEELGRGRQSVQKMRQKLRDGGAPLATWTQDEDDYILSNPQLSESQVADHLGRTVQAVRTRRSLVGRRTGVNFYGDKDPHHVGKRALLAKTCGDCGLLLTPKWFGRRADDYWRSQCIRCRPPQDREDRLAKKRAEREDKPGQRSEFYDRMQAITRDRATKNGDEWVAADHDVLSDPEISILTKALHLGRTYAAVSSQCSRNGYRSLVGHGDPIKGQWVIDNPNAPATQAA